MPRLRQEFIDDNHVNESNNIRKLYSNFDGSNMINFGRAGGNYRGIYADRGLGGGGGDGIEFRSHNDDESGVTSPPLWHTSPPKSPQTDTTPLQSHAYNHHHYRSLSPTSRTQAIARGKEELMDMVKNMPESSYELSLKDLVDNSKIHGIGKTSMDGEKESSKDYNTIQGGKKKKKKKFDKPQMLKSGSMNTGSGPFLLKLFVPSLGLKKKKKSLTTATCAKVSPRPVEGEKFADKDWWKRRLSGIGETDGSGSSGGSSGSSDSRISRNMGDFLPGCWPFHNNKKSTSKEH